MSKHTPGPWEALRREGPSGEVWDVLARNLGPDYDATSSRWIAEDRSEADARLIAAAPWMADFVYAHAARGDKEALAILETAGVSPPPPSGTLTRDEGQPRPGEPDGSRSAL